MTGRFKAAAVGVGGGLALAAGGYASPEGPSVPAQWRHHRESFDYSGTAALFTCPGLEEHVKVLLRFLGARDDIRARARPCAGPQSAPEHFISLDLEFDTLAPAAE